MLSARGWLVLGAGLFLWVVARTLGSATLHIIAVGVAVLPMVAWVFVLMSRHHLTVTRRLSDAKIPLGRRLTVEVEIGNRSATTTSFVLVEDRVPASLGKSARVVLTGLPAHNSQRVRYSVNCRTRGRFTIGPLTMSLSDPFSLTRIRIDFDEEDHVVVFPEVEDLEHGLASPFGAGGGNSLTRHLTPSGEEFYTMREYQMGDDLKRIHWPSVARRGRLMIRQDEASRRGTASLFLDTRVAALGMAGEPGFERAVSSAASIGSLLSRSGFVVRLATADSRPLAMTEEQLLERLAAVSHTHVQTMASSLMSLRSVGAGDSTLVVVTAAPQPAEVASLSRIGSAFGTKAAILVYPVEPSTLTTEGQSELEGRASMARLSLSRAGWEVLVISPAQRLKDAWRANKTTALSRIGSSR